MFSIQRALGTTVLLAASFSLKAQSRLSFNLQKGSTYVQRMDFDVTTETPEQKMNMKIKGTYRLNVSAETDSTKILNVAYERIGMDMDMGMMTISASSDSAIAIDLSDPGSAAASTMARMFQAMKGKSFQLTVNREGKVIGVAGMDALTDAVIGSMGLPEAEQAGARAGFTQQFNERTMRQSFNQAFYIFPARAVKTGDTWSRSYNEEGSSITTNYTVRSIKGNEVTLSTSSVINATGQNLTGSGTGELLIDARTGLVLRGEQTSKLDGNVKVTSKGTYEGSVK
jgi:hypothetical protein